MKKIAMYIGLFTILLGAYGCASSNDETTQLSKEMVAYNSLNEKEQSLTISPKNSTVAKVNVEDVPASVAAAAHNEKHIYAVTFADTATSKHGNLVVYLDDSGQQAIGKSFQRK